MVKSLGQKIRELRNVIGLTQGELAEELELSLKTLQRYENEQSKPDFFALSRLATYFDVPADYLLGICSYEEERKIRSDKPDNQFYRQYIKCKNQYTIDQEATYYWINAYGDEIGGQMGFVGWADSDMKKERRTLRPVCAEKAIKACIQAFGKPMVLNREEDARVFMIYGGEAIVRKDICEKFLPWYLGEVIVERETATCFL